MGVNSFDSLDLQSSLLTALILNIPSFTTLNITWEAQVQIYWGGGGGGGKEKYSSG